MLVLLWNSRGLGHPSKITALRDLLYNERPKILLVQETKQNQQEMQKIIDAQRQYLGAVSSSRGASGGIVTIWNSQQWNCDSATINQNWIRTKLDSKKENRSLTIYNVYVPNQYREKELCWKEIKEGIDSEHTANIIIAGDFNLILHVNEKRSGNFMHDPFRSQLEEIMQENEMVDIIPKNRKYTWSNGRLGAGNIMECLDRFLVNISLLSTFVVSYTNILISSASDHYPILLTMEPHHHLGPIPFKYNPLWSYNSSAGAIIETLSGARRNKKKIKQALEEVQTQIEDQGLSHQFKTQEWDLQGQLMHISREEEIKWRIKSRQLWLKEGDKNTAYFHKQATAKRTRNSVNAIIDSEGNKHNNQEDIKKAASSHFRNLLTKSQEEENYSDLLQYLPKGITQEINDALNREIEEEEIRKAIRTLQLDKSPGPDGFPISFYREYWQLIKKDLAKMLRGVQRKGKMGGFTNSTFLTLIPKENRPTSFSRFRPISLCNSSYKIFTKIIATRLKPLLPSLISENQGGFLSNRQIHDSIILVQEAIHSSLSRQEKGFVLKLDLVNPFN
eukprot:PITA_28479